MPTDIATAIEVYLNSKNADGFLYSGTIDRDGADQMVRLTDRRRVRRPNVCIFITTYGGDPNAAYRIGRALKANYANGTILALLGGYCKSAGTLIGLSADDLAFGCFGELGPLDTQIDKPNEILGAESALDLFQALQQVTASSFESFEQQMINIIRHNSGAITTKVASEIASSLTVGLFSPISAQVDPLRLGVARRANQIGLAYGNRLASKQNVKPGAVEKLVNDYPAHAFVIDQNEARELFKNVRGFDARENEIFELIDQILRVPVPDEGGLISDLREIFSSHPRSADEQPAATDEDSIGAENAEPNDEQCEPEEEHRELSTAGTRGAHEGV